MFTTESRRHDFNLDLLHCLCSKSFAANQCSVEAVNHHRRVVQVDPVFLGLLGLALCECRPATGRYRETGSVRLSIWSCVNVAEALRIESIIVRKSTRPNCDTGSCDVDVGSAVSPVTDAMLLYGPKLPLGLNKIQGLPLNDE